MKKTAHLITHSLLLNFSTFFLFSSRLELQIDRSGSEMMKMKKGILLILLTLCLAVEISNGDESEKAVVVKTVKGKKICTKGWECPTPSKFCCNETISDYFQAYQFENFFSKRNTPVAHAVGFWDYQGFITATIKYQPLGFGTTGTKQDKMKEISAFLAHVGCKTSCEFFQLSYSFLFVIFPILNISSKQ